MCIATANRYMRIVFMCLFVPVINACASESKPIPKRFVGFDLAFGTLGYIVSVPIDSVQEKMEYVLRKHFTISGLRKNVKSDIEEFNLFSEMRTDFFIIRVIKKNIEKNVSQ